MYAIRSYYEQAEKLSPDTSNISITERISAIRPNRKAELQKEREDRKPKEQMDLKDSAEIIPLHRATENDYNYPSFVDELFDDEDDHEWVYRVNISPQSIRILVTPHIKGIHLLKRYHQLFV